MKMMMKKKKKRRKGWMKEGIVIREFDYVFEMFERMKCVDSWFEAERKSTDTVIEWLEIWRC